MRLISNALPIGQYSPCKTSTWLFTVRRFSRRSMMWWATKCQVSSLANHEPVTPNPVNKIAVSSLARLLDVLASDLMGVLPSCFRVLHVKAMAYIDDSSQPIVTESWRRIVASHPVVLCWPSRLCVISETIYHFLSRLAIQKKSSKIAFTSRLPLISWTNALLPYPRHVRH